MPMNPEVRALWLAALRSGEYQQGKSRLLSEGKYCCLGVLCDLHAKSGLGKWLPVRPPYGTPYDNPKNTVVLSPGVMAWAGLGLESPKLGDRTLAEINDTGMSFADIADIIEENL